MRRIPLGPLRRRGAPERGAAAVEFALVAPLLILLLMGIVQYGLYFNDTLGARQGVRVVARMAAVGTASSCPKCDVESQVGGNAADVYVKIVPPTTWKRGQPLLVCVMTRSKGALGVIPLPHGGYVRSKLRMAVEREDKPVAASTETAPSGQDWSWCT